VEWSGIRWPQHSSWCLLLDRPLFQLLDTLSSKTDSLSRALVDGARTFGSLNLVEAPNVSLPELRISAQLLEAGVSAIM